MLTVDAEKVAYLFAGALVSWLFQQVRVAKAEDIAVVNEHIKDLEKLCDAAQNYWLKTPASGEEDSALAARLRANHAATTLLYVRIAAACGNRRGEYERLSQEIFKVSTGGKFESTNREMDPNIAMEVYDLTAQLIHLLRTIRKDILSLRRLADWRVDFER